MITDERAIAKIVFAALNEYEQWLRMKNPGMWDRSEHAEQIACRVKRATFWVDEQPEKCKKNSTKS